MFCLFAEGPLLGGENHTPQDIPEVVSGLVMGTCRHLPDPARVLIPFLGMARVEQVGRPLASRLEGYREARVLLWPPGPGVDGGGAPSRESRAWRGTDNEEALPVPDAQVCLRGPGLPEGWILIESVGPGGVDTRAPGLAPPEERWATHWEVARRATGPDARLLALILVGTLSTIPQRAFQGVQRVLREKGQPPAAIHGLSWRVFGRLARESCPAPPPLLSDLLDLLEDRWGLTEVVPLPWPTLPDSPGPVFRPGICWEIPLPPLPFPLLAGGNR